MGGVAFGAYRQVADRPPNFTNPLAGKLLGVSADGLTEISQRTGDPSAQLEVSASAIIVENRQPL